MDRTRGAGRLVGALAVLAGALAWAAGGLPAQGAEGNPGKAGAKKTRYLKVKRIRPRSGKKFVEPDDPLRVKFSKPIDPASVTNQTVELRPATGTTVAWTFELARGGRELVVKPAKSLAPGTDYQFTIRPGVRTPDGLTLRFPKSSLFFTDPRFSPLEILRPDQFEVLDAQMVEGRAVHSATPVVGGRVLLAGGQADTVVLARGADLFDPATLRFSPATSLLVVPRSYHPAVAQNGSALLVGGWDGTGALSSTDFWNRTTGGFQEGPEMVEERDFHAAVTLFDGRVLVTGGLSYTSQGFAQYSTTAEIMDQTGFHLTAGAPIRRRAGHTLTLLPGGRVLVVGGIGSQSGFGSSAEIFDPETETFRDTAFAPGQYRQLHSATTLPDGRVLLADGGSPLLEVYDPVTERFLSAGGASFVNRTRATASVLPGGRVLLAGGFEQRGEETLILSSMDLFVPEQGDTGRVVRVGVVFGTPRSGHTATTLPDGRVLFAGGFGPETPDSLSTAVLFTPDPLDE